MKTNDITWTEHLEQQHMEGEAVTADPPANTTPSTAQPDLATEPRHAWLNDDLTFAEGWQEKLPEDRFGEYRGMLANYRDLPTLAKSLKDSMAAARAKTDGLLKPPGEDAKPEEIDAFYKALGRPDKPEEYGLKRPGDLPEDLPWNDAMAADFAATAHSLGLNKKQAEGLAAWQAKFVQAEDAKLREEGAAALQEREAKLREAWGSEYAGRLAKVEKVAATFGFDAKDLQFLPAGFTLGLARVADAVSEDKLLSDNQMTNKISPEQYADAVIYGDHADSKIYRDSTHPRHKEIVERVQQALAKA